ncbi:TasA family protein [Conyzicola lurida]|nr:TasA family protein [Conyzicola lurida]
MITATLVAAIALVLSLSAVGGTYAFLSSSQSIALVSATGETSTTISAGTATLAVNGDAISMTALYPGITKTAEFTVTNTGSTSLALSVDSIAGPTAANGLTATVARGTCASAAPAFASGSLGLTLAAQASSTMCLSVAMPTTAPSSAQGVTSSLSVALTGTQP